MRNSFTTSHQQAGVWPFPRGQVSITHNAYLRRQMASLPVLRSSKDGVEARMEPRPLKSHTCASVLGGGFASGERI